MVIPAYNEAQRLGSTLARIDDYLDGQSYEILVVDDGSTDGTAEIARQFQHVRLLRHAENLGKGAAVRRGMLASKGAWILFSDADLSTPISELKRLCFRLDAECAQIAIGSRGLRQANIEVPQPFYRICLGKVFNLIVQAVLLPGIWDTQCGFKLFSRKAALEIFQRTQLDGFGFDVEAIYIAKRLGFKLVEVPVRWRNHPQSKVNAIKDSSRMFIELWQIKHRHRFLQASLSWSRLYEKNFALHVDLPDPRSSSH